MVGDFQEEITVAPSVDELVFGWLAQRETAQDEGSGIVADLGCDVLAFPGRVEWRRAV